MQRHEDKNNPHQPGLPLSSKLNLSMWLSVEPCWACCIRLWLLQLCHQHECLGRGSAEMVAHSMHFPNIVTIFPVMTS